MSDPVMLFVEFYFMSFDVEVSFNNFVVAGCCCSSIASCVSG